MMDWDEKEEDLSLTKEDLSQIDQCLLLLAACPPTIGQILDSGDRAINASGLNPYCVNEGLATREDRHYPWKIEHLRQKIQQIREKMVE
jgi:hypothetical protein